MLDTLTAHYVADDPTAVFPLVLNERWRVADDPLKWIIQYRAGNVSHSDEVKNRKSWKGVHFCRTSAALKQRTRECCGEVDPVALAVIDTWPKVHDA